MARPDPRPLRQPEQCRCYAALVRSNGSPRLQPAGVGPLPPWPAAGGPGPQGQPAGMSVPRSASWCWCSASAGGAPKVQPTTLPVRACRRCVHARPADLCSGGASPLRPAASSSRRSSLRESSSSGQGRAALGGLPCQHSGSGPAAGAHGSPGERSSKQGRAALSGPPGL